MVNKTEVFSILIDGIRCTVNSFNRKSKVVILFLNNLKIEEQKITRQSILEIEINV